jgi:DNA-binding NtrC family response regulator
VLNALIINGDGVGPCPHYCGSLIALLQRAHAFDHIQVTSLDSPHRDVNLTPDLILPRFLLHDWAEYGMQLCKKSWASAKTFAVLCERGLKHHEIPPALLEVDDFLFCPYNESEFLLRIKRVLQSKQEKAQDTLDIVAAGERDPDLLVGESEVFLQAVHKVSLLAQSKAPVVISGETGSGKELLARAIHYQSARSSKPFIPINCGALPDDLFENELFGHAKGAYTNASSAEKGLIAEAEGGTLFLDEVNALSPAAQIKLLRFLQSGEYRPLGCSRAVVADVRTIAASNTDLGRCVEQKQFREDLLYRLNILSLSIPALRDRGNDVLKLASRFLSVYAHEHSRKVPSLSESALAKLLDYSWPGNVRELEGVIQRAIVLRDVEVLTADDLELPTVNETSESGSELFRLGKSRAIGQFERNYIARLLATHGGNISLAAKAAGKDRRSFQRLVNKYGLDRKSFES